MLLLKISTSAYLLALLYLILIFLAFFQNLPMNMAPWKPLLKTTNTLVGFTVMIILCYKWSNYLQTLHENDMWFSNIKVSFSKDPIYTQTSI